MLFNNSKLFSILNFHRLRNCRINSLVNILISWNSSFHVKFLCSTSRREKSISSCVKKRLMNFFSLTYELFLSSFLAFKSSFISWFDSFMLRWFWILRFILLPSFFCFLYFPCSQYSSPQHKSFYFGLLINFRSLLTFSI